MEGSYNVYRQPNKTMAYLTFHKWLVLVCNIHNDIWILLNQNQSLMKSELRYYFIRLTICFVKFVNLVWYSFLKIYLIIALEANWLKIIFSFLLPLFFYMSLMLHHLSSFGQNFQCTTWPSSYDYTTFI